MATAMIVVAALIANRTKPLTGLDNEKPANRDYIFAIHAAKDGSVWAGTWGGGAARFDGERWTRVTRKDGLAGNIVYSIAQESGGALWFGTDAGVSFFDGKNFRNVGAKEGLTEPNVFALALAPKGELWAGGKGAVARIAAK